MKFIFQCLVNFERWEYTFFRMTVRPPSYIITGKDNFLSIFAGRENKKQSKKERKKERKKARVEKKVSSVTARNKLFFLFSLFEYYSDPAVSDARMASEKSKQEEEAKKKRERKRLLKVSFSQIDLKFFPLFAQIRLLLDIENSSFGDALENGTSLTSLDKSKPLSECCANYSYYLLPTLRA